MSASGNKRAGAKTIYWRPGSLAKKIDRARYRSWFVDKDFTVDVTTGHFPMWRRMLSPLRDEPLRILEIGSYEGRSAVFFLNFFKRSTITCIDVFVSAEEPRFDQNLAVFGSRVEKVKSTSVLALEQLAAQERRYDLAYIDGGHSRDIVTSDSLQVWALIPPRGIIIWDDYEYGRHLPVEEQPRPAIDDFLRDHHGQFRLLAKTYQVAIERLE